MMIIIGLTGSAAITMSPNVSLMSFTPLIVGTMLVIVRL